MTGSGKPLVSVIVPVYNEAGTIAEVLDELIELRYDPVDFEIVIIESNSSDGSRAIVEEYAEDTRVKLVLQDEAKGKGNAVRAGFEAATGDIILIQDGDLEYCIAEYPLLLDPILAGDVDFVLGCRHIRGQRIREVPDQRIKGFLLNGAHWAFAALFDVTYGVWLRDPFTMFKVFRAECIERLPLVADRFDFDWELLGKLVRRGYKPIEIPITYQARSFHQGKKVRLFADPPTWVKACFRFRFSRIPPAISRRVTTDVTDPAPGPQAPLEVDLRATQVP
jgi:glycosyltransferase involved in cell wall biosynthesis